MKKLLFTGPQPTKKDWVAQENRFHLGYAHFRQKAGLTLEEAIAATGLENLGDIESGKAVPSHYEVIMHVIAPTYGVTTHDIMSYHMTLDDTIFPAECLTMSIEGYLTMKQYREFVANNGHQLEMKQLAGERDAILAAHGFGADAQALLAA